MKTIPLHKDAAPTGVRRADAGEITGNARRLRIRFPSRPNFFAVVPRAVSAPASPWPMLERRLP